MTEDHRALLWLASSLAAFQPPVHLQPSMTESTEVSRMQKEHLPTFCSLHAPSASRVPIWGAWGCSCLLRGCWSSWSQGSCTQAGTALLHNAQVAWAESQPHTPVEPWKAVAGWQRKKGGLMLPSLHLGHMSTNTEKAAHLLGCGESWGYSRGDGA